MGKQDPYSKLSNSSTASLKQESSITLKVFIHCEGCRRKVKRIIRCVDGVESCEIESGSGKVTVIGRGINSQALLQSLQKAGKYGEVWPSHGGGGMKHPTLGATAGNILKLPPPNNKYDIGSSSSSSSSNAEKNKIKALAFEKLLEVGKGSMKPKGKGGEGGGGGPLSKGGHEMKDLNMVELAEVAAAPLALPPPKSAFPAANNLSPFEKPTMNNVPILSKSMAPRPAVYHGEAVSYMSSRSSNCAGDSTESGAADYATHLFSDENANNCSIM